MSYIIHLFKRYLLTHFVLYHILEINANNGIEKNIMNFFKSLTYNKIDVIITSASKSFEDTMLYEICSRISHFYLKKKKAEFPLCSQRLFFVFVLAFIITIT